MTIPSPPATSGTRSHARGLVRAPGARGDGHRRRGGLRPQVPAVQSCCSVPSSLAPVNVGGCREVNSHWQLQGEFVLTGFQNWLGIFL